VVPLLRPKTFSFQNVKEKVYTNYTIFNFKQFADLPGLLQHEANHSCLDQPAKKQVKLTQQTQFLNLQTRLLDHCVTRFVEARVSIGRVIFFRLHIYWEIHDTRNGLVHDVWGGSRGRRHGRGHIRYVG